MAHLLFALFLSFIAYFTLSTLSQTITGVIKNRARSTDTFCMVEASNGLRTSFCGWNGQQSFIYTTTSTTIKAVTSGLCLVSSGIEGATVTLATCNSSSPFQIWDWDVQERFRLRANPSQCMDLDGEDFENNPGIVVTKACNNITLAQRWYRVICGPGETIASIRTNCVFCSYSSRWNGSHCVECPDHHYSPANRTTCIPYPSHHPFISYGVVTIAGGGPSPPRDGQGTQSSFNSPRAITMDSKNNLYIADTLANTIRKINSSGWVTTIAGDGSCGSQDGIGRATSFCSPNGLLLLGNDTLLVADTSSFKIRMIVNDSVVTTLSGQSASGNANGHVSMASYRTPFSVKLAPDGSVLVADAGNLVIRRMSNNQVTTFLSGLIYAQDIEFDPEGNFLVSDTTPQSVRKFNQSKMTDMPLNMNQCGHVDGELSSARFCQPGTLLFDSKSKFTYLADRQNRYIRRISLDGFVSTIPITGLNNPSSFTFDNRGIIYLADSNNNLIKMIVPCPPGAVWNANRTTCDCPASFLRYNENSNVCDKCSGGQTMVVSSTNRTCVDCPVGTESNDMRSACFDCPPGKHRPSTSLNSCVSCPLGQFKNDTGRNACSACPIGSESSADFSGCSVCSAGTYRPQQGNSTCIPCPSNSLCQPSYAECLPGHHYDSSISNCVKCPNGYAKSYAGNDQCTQCPVGSEPNANRTACIECAEGKFKPSAFELTCIDCPEGAICNSVNRTCISGYTPHSNISHRCQQCSDGFFKAENGNTDCSKCSAGKFSNDDFTECLLCSSGSFFDTSLGLCKRCGVGKQPNYNRTSCTECPASTYKSDDTLQNMCVKCPIGASCTTTSFTCDAGYEVSSDKRACRKCLTGFVKSQPGNAENCVKCGIGQQSNSGNTQCEDCPEGYYRSADVPYPFCIRCPLDTMECQPSGFKCPIGYEFTVDRLSCYPKRVRVEGNLTVVDLAGDETTVAPVDKNSKNSSFDWSRFYVYGIFYAILIPVVVFIAVVSIVIMKLMKWRKRELEMFSSISRKSNLNQTTNFGSQEFITTAVNIESDITCQHYEIDPHTQ